eukprot:Hpha_TRINITY_DN15927_c4_g1::TRINITY_DN15927_c4_g1_i1::g.74228::m.74228
MGKYFQIEFTKRGIEFDNLSAWTFCRLLLSSGLIGASLGFQMGYLAAGDWLPKDPSWEPNKKIEGSLVARRWGCAAAAVGIAVLFGLEILWWMHPRNWLPGFR